MRSYPIWNKVKACVYKNDKSYGVKRTGEVEVRIGTSGSNSHHFLDHKTTHKLLPNGDRVYKFSVDGVIIKEAILKKGADEIERVEWVHGSLRVK